MHFVIHAIDKADAQQRRLAVLDRHRAYLETGPERHGVGVLLSGPLTSDDDTAMIGSFLLVEGPSRASVNSMLQEDPIYSADVWQDLTISRVFLRQVNFATAPDSDH